MFASYDLRRIGDRDPVPAIPVAGPDTRDRALPLPDRRLKETLDNLF